MSTRLICGARAVQVFRDQQMWLAYPPRVPLLDAFARSWVLVLGLVGLAASGAASAADPYAETFTQAGALAAEGRFAAAAGRWRLRLGASRRIMR